MVYLLLGSNEGTRLLWLQQAKELLVENCGTIIQESSVYETAPWGRESQPDFLNMVLSLETTQTPVELLNAIQAIEIMLHRERNEKWGERTLDIDILLYDDLIIKQPDLVIPHPFLHERRFTLTPLAEIAPDVVHPQLNKTIKELLEECPDMLSVERLSRPYP